MALYEYKCGSCGLRFEELRSHKEDSSRVPCRKCGGSADRQMSVFAHKVAGGSTNETVDMTIGREADRRWQVYHDRQAKRRGERELSTFDLPKTKDGKFMPVMGLGPSSEKAQRMDYVGALQEHRQRRAEKGQPQFSGPGEF